MSDERYLPPQAAIEPGVASAPPAGLAAAPKDIGGWLILVAIGLIVSPFRIAGQLLTNYWPIFRDGHWARLTTEGTAGYHPLWAPLIVFELAGNLCLLAIGAATLALFFKKSRKTPSFAITWYAFGAVFSALDLVLANFIPALANDAGGEGTKELSRSIFAAVVWIPYFVMSKRVKETFVR